MTDSLREQVARRLLKIYVPAMEYDEVFSDLRSDFLRVASEVIRIAEWARHGGIAWAQTEEEASYEWRAAHPDHDPLALPPDDWKPSR